MGKDSSSSPFSTPLVFGSDDPSTIQESENLLCQFMRCSSHERQDPSLREPHDQNFVQQNNQVPRQHGLSRTQKPSIDSAIRPTQSSSQKPFTERIKIPRGNIQLRPPPVESATRTSQSVRPSTESKKVSLPIVQRKPPSPARGQSPKSPAVKEVPKTTGIRRSGRSRGGPTNYFQKIRLFDSESEEDVKDTGRKVTKEITASKISPRPRRHVVSSPSSRATSGHTTKRQATSISGLLQRRELGYNVKHRLHSDLMCDFKASKAWKGASNDVMTLAWSPDGTRFAAGAAAQCDEQHMHYNRNNNLLLGDLTNNDLQELPDHWIQRPPGRASGHDPRLFMTVTTVQWFGDTLYTASYDHTVKLWDVSKGKATCFKTLPHDSDVIVMARSHFAENILATGTRSIGLWDIKESKYTALELPRTRSRRELPLEPTSLAWGTNYITKDYLLLGMSEKNDGIESHGLLAGFRVGEASVTTETFSPSSQNVFDIKWHPIMPTFATASTAGQQVSRGSRTVVNLYEPLRLKSRVMEFECPALDINEVSFCPLNPSYISAGCTDGVTYVWDQRNCGQVLHTLQHGEPLNQLDETIPREQADIGVTLQLWGENISHFYTGASDGVLKRWDILRSPEDALVADVALLREEITCGAFSPDKSNLLIGDSSGGIHLLSAGPYSTDGHLQMNYRGSPYKNEPQPDSESGIKAAQDLMSSGQILRHHIYGPGKGPNYKGPYAAWARPEGTPSDQVPQTGLIEARELQQLDGAPPRLRKGLSEEKQKEIEAHRLLSRIRNQKRGDKKRRKEGHTGPKTVAFRNGNSVDLHDDCQEVDGFQDRHKKRVSKTKLSGFVITRVETEIIDLTGDSESEAETPRDVRRSCPQEDFEWPEDDLDEDYWWPDSGEVDPNFRDDDL